MKDYYKNKKNNLLVWAKQIRNSWELTTQVEDGPKQKQKQKLDPFGIFDPLDQAHVSRIL